MILIKILALGESIQPTIRLIFFGRIWPHILEDSDFAPANNDDLLFFT